MKKMRKSKSVLAAVLCAVLVLAILPVSAFAVAPADFAGYWATAGASGYGTITANADGTVTLHGDATANGDGNYPGPYYKANPQSLADGGEIEEEVTVFIDPITMTSGEKIQLTVSINDTTGAYLTERYIYLVHAGNQTVHVRASDASTGDMSAATPLVISKPGLYTLKYHFAIDNNALISTVSVYAYGNATALAESEMNLTNTQSAAAVDCGERRSVWFVDISDADGVRVGVPNAPASYTEQTAPVIAYADWITGDYFGTDYGTAQQQTDPNLVLLKGSTTLVDGNKTGPVVKTKGATLTGSAIVDELHVYIDPADINLYKGFTLSSGLNGADGNYVEETCVNFVKQEDGSVKAEMAIDNGFGATITEAGLYTLKYSFIPGETMVFQNFEIIKDGVSFAKSSPLMSRASISNTANRRYLWFVDISTNSGLKVYSNYNADYTKVDAALATIPADLSLYTDATAAAVTAARTAVVRGKNAAAQPTVDGYTAAIKAAVAALIAKTGTVLPVQPLVAQTGDDSHMALWMLLMLLSVISIVLVRKKRFSK